MALAPFRSEGVVSAVASVIFTGPSGGITELSEIAFYNYNTLQIRPSVILEISRNGSGVYTYLFKEELIPCGWPVRYPRGLIMYTGDLLRATASVASTIDYTISGILISKSK